MKISLLHPSRGRAEKSFNNSKEWIDKAGCEVELILSLDKSDGTNYQYAANYLGFTDKILIEDNDSVVQATNRAAKLATGDILLYLSDDFKCFDNWGVSVIKEFEGLKYAPYLVKVDDCLQQFTVPVLTIPIMNRALYDKLGYFWHPEYKSMFVDEDLFWTASKHGTIKYCPHLKFPHHHVCNGKAPDDETYRRSAANWEQGKAVFAKHKALGFPL